ncbi:MAG: hypothetical protein V1774_12305 [Candidatus Eisenbacteria bacterium]
MSSDLSILAATAASLGFIHTVLGPDHYLPFIAMSRSGKWSRRKTALVTLASGLGHVLSSVVIGTIGIALGLAVTSLEALESSRATIAAWMLIAFGLTYFAWGLHRALRQGAGRGHAHLHRAGIPHMHADAPAPPAHDEGHPRRAGRLTPWVLFTIFIFGPCEPLIPLLMYPAARQSTAGIVLVAAVFSSVTVLTMLAIVSLSSLGLRFLPAAKLERYSHALAGLTILLCGVGIQALGL